MSRDKSGLSREEGSATLRKHMPLKRSAYRLVRNTKKANQLTRETSGLSGAEGSAILR